MKVDLFIRVSEDNPRFTAEFHQYMVFAEVELDVAKRFILALSPQNLEEGLAFQREEMQGHCGYGMEKVRAAFDVLPKTTMATAITNLAGWVADRKLIDVEYRRDTKGVLVTGIYATEAALAEVA